MIFSPISSFLAHCTPLSNRFAPIFVYFHFPSSFVCFWTSYSAFLQSQHWLMIPLLKFSATCINPKICANFKSLTTNALLKNFQSQIHSSTPGQSSRGWIVKESQFCLACPTPPLPNEFITAADEGWVAMCAYLLFSPRKMFAYLCGGFRHAMHTTVWWEAHPPSVCRHPCILAFPPFLSFPLKMGLLWDAV